MAQATMSLPTKAKNWHQNIPTQKHQSDSDEAENCEESVSLKESRNCEDTEAKKENRNGEEESETVWWNWIDANDFMITNKESNSINTIYEKFSNTYYWYLPHITIL